MPEGHVTHRLARTLTADFGGRPVRVSSPQGRFADAAVLLDGTVLEGAEAVGKHLFVRFEGDRIVRVEEKPANPLSNYAVIGIYMYDRRVFEFIRSLKPSQRGELEITDVNNFYIREGKMEWDVLDGWWTDAGTFESLQYAGNMVAKTGANRI